MYVKQGGGVVVLPIIGNPLSTTLTEEEEAGFIEVLQENQRLAFVADHAYRGYNKMGDVKEGGGLTVRGDSPLRGLGIWRVRNGSHDLSSFISYHFSHTLLDILFLLLIYIFVSFILCVPLNISRVTIQDINGVVTRDVMEHGGFYDESPLDAKTGKLKHLRLTLHSSSKLFNDASGPGTCAGHRDTMAFLGDMLRGSYTQAHARDRKVRTISYYFHAYTHTHVCVYTSLHTQAALW